MSKIVEISGILIKDIDGDQVFNNFSLILDRSPETKEGMRAKYDEAYTALRSISKSDQFQSIDNYSIGENCDTSFKYFTNPREGK